ncbi:cytochrome P450 [Melanogaster broomeanus]|nr:cytochrome P450 [Melanogaster broomeanus]
MIALSWISSLPLLAVHVDDVLDESPLLLGGLVVVLLIWLFVVNRRTNPRGLPFPPGPKPLPLVGNIFHMNTAEPWLSYTAWKKKYGDLLHVRLLGQDFIVLNSEKVARALLEQRSAIYSDRPVIPTHEMFGMGFSTVMLPYGDEWRLHRKLFHQAFRLESESRHREVYLTRARTLLTNLLDAPADFEVHLKSFVASNVMALAYGYEMAARDDPMVRTVRSLVNLLAKALSPERAAVLSAFPILERLPAWLPGAGFKRDAIYGRELAAQVLDVPFNWVKDKMALGIAPPSMVADCLSQINEKDDYDKQEYAIKATAATVFLGVFHSIKRSISADEKINATHDLSNKAGFETSSSTLHAFILAMLLYPDVQAQAQAEIDSVIGSSRLPDFDDRPSLPYIDAILRELVRWNPAYHTRRQTKMSTKDTIFQKVSALVVANVWAMGRDEDKFTDVEQFKPERFLTPDGKLVESPLFSNPIFGLGRRICPGRFASDAFVWTAVVSILAAFRITKAKDAEGKEIDVTRQFTTGIAVCPVEFPCWFISRSAEREKTIRESV